MTLPRQEYFTHIIYQLNFLASLIKSYSRSGFTDANKILESIAKRFFNALFKWNLENLNSKQQDYPSVDLGDYKIRIAIQVTNAERSEKIEHTATEAEENHLKKDFDKIYIFFLLPKKPAFPKKFVQPTNCPEIETWDIPDIEKKMEMIDDHDALKHAAEVLDEEIGKISVPITKNFDISRILKYAPDKLIGREEEIKLLNDAWAKVQNQEKGRPHILTFVALGGEGKTALVAKWVAEFAGQDWPGCDSAFAWSFYSQGSHDQATSSDFFLREALNFFGDKETAESAKHSSEKGKRLAQLVGERHTLLILDGIEPLQYPPGPPMDGKLKDDGLATLLKGLAQKSLGLCIVTTRYSIPDIKAFWQTTAPKKPLLSLSKEAGVRLLQRLGVRKESGSKGDFEKLVEDVKGHALTINLLGTYLRDAHGGDIRKRDFIKLEEADTEIEVISDHPKHLFHVMDAYVKWFEKGGKNEEDNKKGHLALALLKLIGLFDRPATAVCLSALWTGKPIPSLTEPLVGLNEKQRNMALTRLEDAKLLTVNRNVSGTLASLDAHPHIREYFAKQLRENSRDAWRAAHRRLYEHLYKHKEGVKPTLVDLQPLYQAVAHACKAKLYSAAVAILRDRIQREEKFYSTYKLGAIASDHAAFAGFFAEYPYKLDTSIPQVVRSYIYRQIAYCFRSRGLSDDAVANYEKAIREYKYTIRRYRKRKKKVQTELATTATLLAELLTQRGELVKAIKIARMSIKTADSTGDAFKQTVCYTHMGNVLMQASGRDKASDFFIRAKAINDEQPVEKPTLVLGNNYRYCDWLLDFGKYDEVLQRLKKTLAADQSHDHLGAFSNGFRCLICARALTMRNKIRDKKDAINNLQKALIFFEKADRNDYTIKAYLGLANVIESPQEVVNYLNKAWQIAERGSMRLHMADIHLYRARLFGRKKAKGKSQKEKIPYPWKEARNWKGEWITNRTAKDDLDDAEALINKCGYHRRDEELADAKKVILRKT